MRLRAMTTALLLAVASAACSSPATTTGAQPSQQPASPPATPVADAADVAPGTPDLSCKVAGDCAVKNVGNCCGYFPACVNKDSTVDPDAVRAECERTGTSSVCGWKDIQACECVQGQCRGVSGPLEVDR